MRRFLGLCLLCGLLGAALAGCATPPEPPRRTTLILLPDDDGRVGSATLGNAQGLQTLHEAFSGTSAVGTAGAPARAQVLGKDAVDARYASLLAAQPLPPRSFTLYFLHGKTDMTEASKARLPELLRAAQERRPAVIAVFGHADASGGEQFNLPLSIARAHAVARLLRRTGAVGDDMDVRGLGSADPLNEPGVGPLDPRNRRVEIQIF